MPRCIFRTEYYDRAAGVFRLHGLWVVWWDVLRSFNVPQRLYRACETAFIESWEDLGKMEGSAETGYPSQ